MYFILEVTSSRLKHYKNYFSKSKVVGDDQTFVDTSLEEIVRSAEKISNERVITFQSLLH